MKLDAIGPIGDGVVGRYVDDGGVGGTATGPDPNEVSRHTRVLQEVAAQRPAAGALGLEAAAQARLGAVEWGPQDRGGAVEQHHCVASRHVERRPLPQPQPPHRKVRRVARVRPDLGRPYGERARGGVHPLDLVPGPSSRRELEDALVAAQLVPWVAAVAACAEWLADFYAPAFFRACLEGKKGFW